MAKKITRETLDGESMSPRTERSIEIREVWYPLECDGRVNPDILVYGFVARGKFFSPDENDWRIDFDRLMVGKVDVTDIIKNDLIQGEALSLFDSQIEAKVMSLFNSKLNSRPIDCEIQKLSSIVVMNGRETQNAIEIEYDYATVNGRHKAEYACVTAIKHNGTDLRELISESEYKELLFEWAYSIAWFDSDLENWAELLMAIKKLIKLK